VDNVAVLVPCQLGRSLPKSGSHVGARTALRIDDIGDEPLLQLWGEFVNIKA